MTKRAYWDAVGGLWEEHDYHSNILILVWSPYAAIEDMPRALIVNHAQLHKCLGPLVGVA